LLPQQQRDHSKLIPISRIVLARCRRRGRRCLKTASMPIDYVTIPLRLRSLPVRLAERREFSPDTSSSIQWKNTASDLVRSFAGKTTAH